jgi:branched-subunit amino acid aminotransferase/4-amino-4-deoxychorismate lyase
MKSWSETWTFVDGDWLPGNPPLTGPRSHAFWLGTSVFDGARFFDGVMPDLDRHCARLNASAPKIGLKATRSVDQMMALAADGVKKFAPGTALYIKPMYWAEYEDGSAINPDAETTRFCLCIFEAAMPQPMGWSVTLSPFRPTPRRARSTPTMPAPCARRRPAALPMRWSAIFMATLPRPAPPTCSWSRMALSGRRCRTAPSSTASPGSG